jgi:hypothetical protein
MVDEKADKKKINAKVVGSIEKEIEKLKAIT